ncbi:MAG: LysM peptidoglycan-binding domain-containing protein [Cytophagales bacterium]|nr:LysM peptidoglycan-binding domain-containing protein [Bernardetiaceae bacterium]MDW8204009.1 LysM peptidoglycan-binding domain-containing protein [Cytophagales bacterium]
MNKLFFSLCLVLLNTIQAIAQEGQTVPSQMRFADLELSIEPRTRDRIQQRVNQIVGNWTMYKELSERSQIYAPLIIQVLREEGCPEDLQYVAMQRSGLIVDYTTPRYPGATGIWLMTADIAKTQGLQVDNAIDERKSIIAATRAFARTVQQYNYSLKNWIYTCTAYDIGFSEAFKNNEFVDRSRIGMSQLMISERAPESIIDLLAYTFVFRNQQNLPPATIQLLVYQETKGKSLDAIARATDLPLEQVRYYNSWLLGSSIPSNRNFPVYLPVPHERVAAVSKALKLENPNQGFAATASRGSTTHNSYPVVTNRIDRRIGNKDFTFATINGIPGMIAADGQSIDELAAAAGISKKRFIKLNDLNHPTAVLGAGQVLYLKAKPAKGPVKEHVAQPGETFWSVAQTYGIALNSLLKNNRIEKNETLQPGRVLLLQERRAKNVSPEYRELPPAIPTEIVQNTPQLQIDNTPDSDPNANALVTGIHIVQPNESLYDIAQKYQVTITDLRRWNGIPGFTVSAGTELKIRGEASSTTVAVDTTRTTIAGTDQPTIKTDTSASAMPPTQDIDVLPATNNLPTHTVKPGDNIYSIALQYKIPLADLRKWNNLQSTNTIKVGDVLKLYDPQAQHSVLAGESNKLIVVGNTTNATPTIHKVQRGETLFSISKKYNVSIDNLRAWNNLRSDALAINQQLVVSNPEGSNNQTVNTVANTNVTNVNILPREGVPAAKSSNLHQVRFGESVEDVVRLYSIDINDFYRWNNLPPGTTALMAGSQVYIADPATADSNAVNVTPQPYTNPAMSNSNAHTSANTVATAPPTTDAANQNTAVATTKSSTYQVQAGETLWSISRKLNISFTDLLAWNNMDMNTKLQLGQIIRIQPPTESLTTGIQGAGTMLSNLTEPVAGNMRGEAGLSIISANPTPAAKEEARIYITVPGDNIYDLANRFGVRLSEFRKWNNIPPGTFSLPAGTPVAINEAASGQVAAMKAQSAKPNTANNKGFVAETARANPSTKVPQGSVVYHVVSKGETLFSIAKKYNVKVAQIKAWNKLKNDRVNAGARIIVSQ